MVHTISAKDVHNLALRGGNNERLAFRCSHHKAKTKGLVAGSINELVRNPAFTSLFANFLPDASASQEAQLNIRVTKEALIVEDTSDANRSKTVKFSDLNASHANEAAILATCQTLIQKVDKVYRKCMNEAEHKQTKAAHEATAQWAADAMASHGLIPLNNLQEYTRLAENMKTSEGTELSDTFRDYVANLPPKMRQDIFHYLYELKGQSSTTDEGHKWSLGERYFFEHNYNGVTITYQDRAQAIRLAILKQLASHYDHAAFKTEKQAAKLKQFYEGLAQEDRTDIETYLWLLKGGPDVHRYGHKAFFELEGYSATDVERAEAIRTHITAQIRA